MTTFPDEKMIEAAKDRAVVSPYVAQLVIETAFANLKERTGIDAGDVLAKLAAGTHKLVSVDDLAQIRAIAAANLVMNLTDRAAQEE